MTYGPKPDFAVVGGQYNGQVTLWASKSLSSAELEVRRDYDRLYRDSFYRTLKSESISLTLEISDYVVVVADNYRDAWSSLFDCWAPPSAKPNELAALKQIER